MPLYCFTSEAGKTIEEFFPMGRVPEYLYREGAAWPESGECESEVVGYARDMAAEWSGKKSGARGEWPIVCYASGVHASQAQELRDHFKKHGCPTEVTSDGDPVYRDSKHQRRALACRGLHNNASFGTEV